MTDALEAHLRDRRARRAQAARPLHHRRVPRLAGRRARRRRDGADAIEIGIPFSDPVMDGPVIQEASQQALEAGATPVSILDEARTLDVGIPLAVMTYYNTVFHTGHERFAEQLAAAGIDGAIVPDLPLEESGPWCAAADAAGIETVMLAAPTAPDERLPRICARARGFVYSVGLLGVTGERDHWPPTAVDMAARLKAITDVPVLVGVGVSNAEQARGGVHGRRRRRAGRVGGPPVDGATAPTRWATYVAEVRLAIDG